MKFVICRFGRPILEISPSDIVEAFVPNGYGKAYELAIVEEKLTNIADDTQPTPELVKVVNGENYFHRRPPLSSGNFIVRRALRRVRASRFKHRRQR